MKLFTVYENDKECVAVENKAKELVTLDSIGISVTDMNDLIRRYDELKEDIQNKLNAGKGLQTYKILSPITVPMQDRENWRIKKYNRINSSINYDTNQRFYKTMRAQPNLTKYSTTCKLRLVDRRSLLFYD